MAKPEVEILIKAKDEASKAMTGITGKIQGMSKQLKIAGGIMAAGGIAITAALGMAAKAAAEEEKGITRMVIAMRNVGVEYDDVKGSLEAWIDTQQQKTAIADTEQRDSLSTLIRMTGNLEEAQDKLTLAMDIAVGTNKDLNSATQLVAYAMGGNWGMVERYIPALKAVTDETEKWRLLQELFAGQAEAFGETMAGQMQLLQHNIGDVKEAIGAIVVEAIGPLFKRISELLPTIKAWIAEHPKLTKIITLGALAFGLLLIPLGGLLIMLPMLAAGIGMVTAVSLPWLLIIGALVAGVALLAFGAWQLYLQWDKVVAGMIDLWEGLKSTAEAVFGAISAFVMKPVQAVLQLWENLQLVYQMLLQILGLSRRAAVPAGEYGVTAPPGYLEDLTEAEREQLKEWQEFEERGRAEVSPSWAAAPEFQYPGIVPGRLGQRVPIIAHGGEMFLGAGGRAPIQNIIQVYLDGELVTERMIDRITEQVRLRGGF